jgi:hypothetical protein
MIAQMAKNVRRMLSRAAVAGLTLLAASLPSYANRIQDLPEERRVAMTMKDDLVNRSPEIHWPQGFDPTTADLFSHNELLIRATCERVWQHIVEAAKMAGMVSQFKGCADRRRRRDRLEGGYNLPLDYIWTSA